MSTLASRTIRRNVFKTSVYCHNKPVNRTLFSNPNASQIVSSRVVDCRVGKSRMRNQFSKTVNLTVGSRTFFSRISCDNGINEGANEAVKVLVENSATVVQKYETLYYGTRVVIETLEWFHVSSGCPYWASIIIGTVALRVVLFPVGVMTAQASARMAIARPEMLRVSDAMKNDPRGKESAVVQRYQLEMQSIFKKNKVNPIRAAMMPIVQIPVFLFIFFGLNVAGDYLPDYKTGGDFWFVNLAGSDPYLILPIVNAATFLMMIEIGADEASQMENKENFKNGMRALSVAMVPLMYKMAPGLFLYWITTNVLSIGQAGLLKSTAGRRMFNVPALPIVSSAIPGVKIVNPMKSISSFIEKERAKNSTSTVEILHGINSTTSSMQKSATTVSVLDKNPLKKK